MADRGIGGTVHLRAGDRVIVVGGRCDIDLSKVVRTEKTGMNGATYYTEEPKAPTIEVEFLTTPETDIEALENLTDADCVAVLRNGKLATLESAFVTGGVPTNMKEGTGTLRLVGLDGEWI